VVEDTVTTGGSALQAVDAITEFGATVVAVVCLLDRGGELAGALATRSIPFVAVLGAPDLGYEYGE